mgnify:CR=1 FL=1
MNKKNINIWILASTSFLVTPDTLKAQNYVEAEDYLEKTTTVQFYDGIGRPTSLSIKGLNTSGKCVCSLTEYDEMGRECRQWLPVPENGLFNQMTPSSISSLSSTYFQDHYGYCDTEYDALGRTVFVSAPGQEWNAKKAGKIIEYLTNGANTVKKYVCTTQNAIKPNGYYHASTLTGTKVTDADGHTIETYKDFLGNVVLERRNGDNDTYYVYEKNRLAMVLPPECQNVTNNSNMVYRYKYDTKGRCIQKNLPGNVIIKYWYDIYGRLAFMQDGLLRASSKYRFYLYDGLSRLAVQGITADASVTNKPNFTAKVAYGSGAQAVSNTGYYIANSSDGFIIDDTEIINYYDGYNCLSNSLLSAVKSQVGTIPSVCTTSLITAQVVATSGKKNLCRVIFYDSKNNITAIQEFRPDSTQLNASHRFSSTNKPTLSTMSVTRNGKTITVQDSLIYCSKSDMVLEHWQKVDSRPFVKAEAFQYDNLGKLKTLSYYNDNMSTKYTYDIHGWTKSINSIMNNTNKLLFGEKLYYADACGTKYYNGNISEVRWLTADYPMGDQIFTGYKYSYDGMDRLTSAKCTYGSWTHSDNIAASTLGFFDLDLTYDANSAIKTLKRTGKQNTSGTYGLIDDLTYYYSNGRLNDVADKAVKPVYDGAFNFVDNTINTHGGACDYAYNANGALTRDYNKGISSISYDQFGYPLKVTFGNKSSIEYVYSADGVKLKTRHITAVPQGNTGPSSSSINYIMSKDSTDYIGDFVYHNNKFSRYNWGNGYVQPLGGTSYAYRFYFKDHQGNNRLVTSYTGTILQTTHYYPDGVTHDKSTEQGLQKYKYNGKELDRMHGLDWYDYGVRQYASTIGQFTSMDPLCEKYYHISPYVYCAGNPVRYVDPDGRHIRVSGSADFRLWVLSTLQMLTNDRLAMSKNGYIFIAKNGRGRANTSQDLVVGTGLLREVIENNHTAFVSLGDNTEQAVLVGKHYDGDVGRNVYTNEYDRYNGKGTNVKIAIRSGEVPDMLVSYNENDLTRKEACPEYITVAHEFIHGIHDMSGEKSPNESVLYYYIDNKGTKYRFQAGFEELQTVGIVGNYRYSENKIRKEHGLRLRRKY